MAERIPDHIRMSSWSGDPEIAMLVPAPGTRATPAAIERCMGTLADRGYRSVLTSALTLDDAEPFLDVGFEVHKMLHLLGFDLSDDSARVHAPIDKAGRRSLLRTADVRLRRGRRCDVPGVLAVDAAAFDPFWRFDRVALDDARSAAPVSRWRVANRDGAVGYSVVGRSGKHAYLQRLAVHPKDQNRGIGTLLAIDALVWARRHGAIEVLVNTQSTNSGGLKLYERLGFVRKAHGLVLLKMSLQKPGAPL